MQNEYVGDTMPFTALATGQGHLTSGFATQPTTGQPWAERRQDSRRKGSHGHSELSREQQGRSCKAANCPHPGQPPAWTPVHRSVLLSPRAGVCLQRQRDFWEDITSFAPRLSPRCSSGNTAAVPDIPLCHGFLCSPLLLLVRGGDPGSGG